MPILNKRKTKGFNLIEIIVTIIIIGILATLAVVRYGPTREQVYDIEAGENLRLMQAAEKLYRARFTNIFYPDTAGTPTDNATINSYLKLDLPTINQRWDYQTFYTGCVQATRTGSAPRSWYMGILDDESTSGLCP